MSSHVRNAFGGPNGGCFCSMRPGAHTKALIKTERELTELLRTSLQYTSFLCQTPSLHRRRRAMQCHKVRHRIDLNQNLSWITDNIILSLRAQLGQVARHSPRPTVLCFKTANTRLLLPTDIMSAFRTLLVLHLCNCSLFRMTDYFARMSRLLGPQ